MFQKFNLFFVAFTLLHVMSCVDGTYAAQNFSKCGIKNKKLETRIVNGASTEVHEYPWMAAVLKSVYEGVLVAQTCGGALIHPKWVLTAAHCLRENTADQIYVLLGEYDFDVEDMHTELLQVEEIIMHPNFHLEPAVMNDIGLIKLRHGAVLTKTVRPICLPSPPISMNDLFGAKALTLGWGKTSTNGKPSHKLQKASLLIHDSKICENLYPNLFSSGFLCVGGDGEDVCFGDSGGPLMIEDDERFYIAGVVSYGINECARLGNPSIFTYVPSHLEFIHEHVRFNASL